MTNITSKGQTDKPSRQVGICKSANKMGIYYDEFGLFLHSQKKLKHIEHEFYFQIELSSSCGVMPGSIADYIPLNLDPSVILSLS